MIEIGLHKINLEEVIEDLEWKDELIEGTLVELARTNNFGYLFTDNCEALAMCIVSKCGKLTQYVDLAMDAIECNFLFATQKLNTYAFTSSGRTSGPIDISEDFNKSYKTGLPTYIQALYLAIISRKNNVIQNLIEIKNTDIPDQNSFHDDFFGSYADFLRSVLAKDGNAGELLKTTYKGLMPDKIQYANYDYLESNEIPHLELWIKLLGGDEDEFNEFLVKGLNKHKSYWGSNEVMSKGNKLKLKDYPEGFISIPLTAICVLAKNNGINVKVKSDYIPESLLDYKAS